MEKFYEHLASCANCHVKAQVMKGSGSTMCPFGRGLWAQAGYPSKLERRQGVKS